MKKIGIAIVGWGFMGRMHSHALRSLPLFYPNAGFEAEIRCVCSRRLEMAREGARDLGCARFTDNYRDILTMEDIDVVSICTPNAAHAEMAAAFMRAGKHIYIDKPLAVTAEDAELIARTATETGVFTRVAFNNRFYPATLRAKELINEGKIGEILTLNARYLHSGSIAKDKPIGWKQSAQGGVILDLGSHVLDLLTWLCGYPESIFCATRTLYSERPTKTGETERDLSEDHAIMTIKMPSGALGFVECGKISTGANDELSFEIRGDKGAIKFDLMQPNYLEFFDNTLPERPLGGERGFTKIETVGRYPAPGGTFLPPKNTLGWDRGHTHCYFTFLDSLARGETPECGVAEAARLQRLMSAAAKSAADEKWTEVK